MRESDAGQENEKERKLQREVLAYALVEHPLPMALSDLREELGPEAQVDRAVAALVADGLVVLEEDEVMPTPAAVRYNEIEPIEPPAP
jgi:hypothetical protein